MRNGGHRCPQNLHVKQRKSAFACGTGLLFQKALCNCISWPESSYHSKSTYRPSLYHGGPPQRLHSDQGRSFESHILSELCKAFGVEKSHMTPYHPMGDACVWTSQTNELFSAKFTKNLDRETIWLGRLPAITSLWIPNLSALYSWSITKLSPHKAGVVWTECSLTPAALTININIPRPRWLQFVNYNKNWWKCGKWWRQIRLKLLRDKRRVILDRNDTATLTSGGTKGSYSWMTQLKKS